MPEKFSKVPEELWALVAPLIPPEPPKPYGGRPRVPDQTILAGVLYRLHTGCQWKALPPQFGSGATCHRRFSQWVASGLFEKIMSAVLKFYDQKLGIAWDWTSMDAAIVKAPKGGDDTGPNPTDRAKSGTKRHVLTDERGVPLSIKVSGANVPDMRMALPTLDAAARYVPGRRFRPVHICLDKGYDYNVVDKGIKKRRIIGHTRRRGEPPLIGCAQGKPRRWVVERTNSWHNRFRALLIRWERKAGHYLALCLLASAIITLRTALA
jgi:putative transposase